MNKENKGRDCAAGSSRPYERCEQFGPSVLSDAELLAVILRTGGPGMDATELAGKVLALTETENGILGLLHLTLPELRSLKGVGRVKAIQLQCIGELSRRISKAQAAKGRIMDSPDTIAAYYMEDMRHLGQEQLILVLLNTKNQLIKDMVLSKGTVNASIVTPREILVEALRFQAVRFVILHNHPSGDPEPSREDIQLTIRIREAGNLIGICLMDHLIIGDQAFVSMKERGLL